MAIGLTKPFVKELVGFGAQRRYWTIFIQIIRLITVGAVVVVLQLHGYVVSLLAVGGRCEVRVHFRS